MYALYLVINSVLDEYGLSREEFWKDPKAFLDNLEMCIRDSSWIEPIMLQNLQRVYVPLYMVMTNINGFLVSGITEYLKGASI